MLTFNEDMQLLKVVVVLVATNVSRYRCWHTNLSIYACIQETFFSENENIEMQNTCTVWKHNHRLYLISFEKSQRFFSSYLPFSFTMPLMGCGVFWLAIHDMRFSSPFYKKRNIFIRVGVCKNGCNNSSLSWLNTSWL